MRAILVFLLFTSLILNGCKTTSTEPIQTPPGNFTELTADDSFNWSTTKTVTITVEGFETVTPVTRALVISEGDGHVLYKQAMDLNGTTQVTIEVPSPTTTLIVKYGNILRATEINGTTAAVSLATPDDYQY